jgi:hypothetical protein
MDCSMTKKLDGPMARKRKKQAKPAVAADPDPLAEWIRLGGGVTDSELTEMTEAQQNIAHGNAWIRSQLMPSSWRTAPGANPFGRDRE